MKPVLKVFVTEHCSNCNEARVLAAHIEQEYPEIVVQIIDLDRSEKVIPDEVFATPTFMLNNQVISLGNPYLEEIVELVEEVIAQTV
jgi:thiol-disulfide isomerase/thioredoxin